MFCSGLYSLILRTQPALQRGSEPCDLPPVSIFLWHCLFFLQHDKDPGTSQASNYLSSRSWGLYFYPCHMSHTAAFCSPAELGPWQSSGLSANHISHFFCLTSNLLVALVPWGLLSSGSKSLWRWLPPPSLSPPPDERWSSLLGKADC